MRLLVDMGNSRIKWWGPGVTGCEPLNRLELAVKQWRWLELNGIFVSCVSASSAKQMFFESCIKTLGVEPEFVAVRQGFMGLKLAYENTQSFGVDRWLAMLSGLREVSGKDFVVVDAGTAITVDFVCSAEHLGGWILPGVAHQKRFYQGLFDGVTKESLDITKTTPGRSTIDGVKSGLGNLAQGVVQMIRSCAEESLEDPVFFVTGGDAGVFVRLASDFVIRDNMVFDGLSLVSPV